MPGCLDTWMPVTRPSARPSFFHSNCCCSIAWKETCCCSRSSITESWRMEFPQLCGGIWESGEPKISKSCTVLWNQWLEQSTSSRWTTCLCVISKWTVKCCQKDICFALFLFDGEGAFSNQSVLPHLHYLLSSQRQGSWENVGTIADELRTSSSWQERLEHRSEEFLMRS